MMMAKRSAATPELKASWASTLVIGWLWAYSVVPGLVAISSGSLRTVSPLGTISLSRTAPGEQAAAMLLVMGLPIVAAALLTAIVTRRVLPLGMIGVLIACILPVLLSTYLEGQSIVQPLLVLAIGSALMYAGVGEQQLRFIAWLVCARRYRLCLGGLIDVGWMPASTNDAEKWTPLPRLLAGSFGHSNTLSLVLGLGLPVVLRYFSERRALMILGAGIVGIALTLSASRVTLLATFVGLAAGAIVWGGDIIRPSRAFHHGSNSRLRALILAPLLAADPTAYTNRGSIGIAGFSPVFGERPLAGYGADAFADGGEVSILLGFSPQHGHSVLITALVTGGLIGAVGTLFIFLPCGAEQSMRPRLVRSGRSS